jgi:zinc transporter, ZIP family
MAALKFALIPMIAIMIGALLAGWRTPGERLVAAMQHLAAGVVFAAAATEILPLVMHGGSPAARCCIADRRCDRRRGNAGPQGGGRPV